MLAARLRTEDRNNAGDADLAVGENGAIHGVPRRGMETFTRGEAAALRLATRHDTAFGSPEFVEELERKYGVQLHAKPLGRPVSCPRPKLRRLRRPW